MSNLGTFWLCLIFSWLCVPIVFALAAWLKVYNTTYKITSQRLVMSTGVFSKHTEELDLYRVKDITLDQPFLLRMFSLGNIVLRTSDKSTPIVRLKAVPKAENLREVIRQHVEELREKKQVREVDFD